MVRGRRLTDAFVTLLGFAYPLPTEDMIWGRHRGSCNRKRFMGSEAQLVMHWLKLVLLRRMQNGDKKPFTIYDENPG